MREGEREERRGGKRKGGGGGAGRREGGREREKEREGFYVLDTLHNSSAHVSSTLVQLQGGQLMSVDTLATTRCWK